LPFGGLGRRADAHGDQVPGVRADDATVRIADGRITRIREYLDTDLTRSVFG